MTLLCGTQCYATEMEEIDQIEENIEENIEVNIEVKDVEIANYEKELNVDATMNLTVTVLPENAMDSTVTYKSSNPEVATVSSTGEVKGTSGYTGKGRNDYKEGKPCCKDSNNGHSIE